MDHLSTGSKIVLLICLLIHPFVDNCWIISLFRKHDLMKIYYFVPILGWIADVHIQRYKMIKLSLILNLLAGVVALFFIYVKLEYIPLTS